MHVPTPHADSVGRSRLGRAPLHGACMQQVRLDLELPHWSATSLLPLRRPGDRSVHAAGTVPPAARHAYTTVYSLLHHHPPSAQLLLYAHVRAARVDTVPHAPMYARVRPLRVGVCCGYDYE
jgi:hypothetical protein